MRTRAVKCVVWDLDDTVWAGVALERRDGALPEPRSEVLEAVDFLAAQGVLSSIASRTAPAMAEQVRTDPRLADRFVAAQLSWEDKSAALRRIADELGLGLDTLVLVDDSAYERAQVSAALPDVEVLTPDEVAEWLDSPVFQDQPDTEESRFRVRRYQDEQRRQDAALKFGGTRDEFYRQCDMRLRITRAETADLDRVHELAERTHRLNSTSELPDREWLAEALADPKWLVPAARLSDVFGDYGLIGTAFVHCAPQDAPDTWRVTLLALSCRIAGRGVGVAFLRWLMDQASTSGARWLAVDSRPTEANTELRVLFKQCGLRTTDTGDLAHIGDIGNPAHLGHTERTTLWRSLDSALPVTPAWLAREAGGDEVEESIRDMLAEATGRPRAEVTQLPPDVSLFAPEIALASVEGVRLLTLVKQRFGVDIAAEDLNLDALESIRCLSAFVNRRIATF